MMPAEDKRAPNKKGRPSDKKTAGSSRSKATAKTPPLNGDFYRSCFHDSGAAIAAWQLLRDKRGRPQGLRFAEVAEAFAKMLGLSDPVGKSVGELLPDFLTDKPSVLEVCSRVVETRVSEAVECYDSRLGKWLNLRVRPSSLTDHVLAIVADITKDRATAAALERSRYLLDQIRDYPVWTDPEGNIIEVNESTCRQLEYTRDELLSMKVFDISPTLTPKFWKERWQLLREVGSSLIETVHRNKTGRLIPVELSTSLITYDENEYHCAFCRDIADRKEADAALHRLRYSLDNLHNDYPIWSDTDGRITEVTESTCRALEYSRQELLEMTIFDICPQMDQQAWEEGWQDTLQHGSFRVEVKHRTKSGRVFPVEVTVNPMVFEDEEYHCVFCRDITERKELTESLDLTRFSVDSAPDMIYWLDEQGRIIFANQSTCRFLGYSREELAQRHIWDFDHSLDPGSWPEKWRFVRETYPFLHEEVLVDKNGQEHSVEISSNHLEYEGNEYGVTVARDITERKKIEESLHLTMLSVENAPDMIHWVDREGNIRYANQSTCRFLGYSSEELSDMKIWEVSPTLTPDRFVERWNNTTDSDMILTDEVWTARDGSDHDVEISATNVIHEGTELGIAFVRDVTERRETLSALRERDEQLRQSQKMEAVGRLAGGVAHDFNNVLTTIIGYSDLILSSPDLPEGSLAEDVGEIKAAAERASALTRRVLAFSRRQPLKPAMVSLNSVVTETERLLSRTLGADVELKISLDPELWEVELDEDQFVQVLLNLAVNARDAMPEGGTLTLSTANGVLGEEFCRTHPDVEPGPYVMMTISDTGVGMDQETLTRIFEPFYTTKPPGEGTGLGLSTVYGMVTQSKGHIEAHSDPGKGTTFTIYVPRAAASDKKAGTTLPPKEADTSTVTVLLVDEDFTFAGITERVLRRNGYKVMSIADPEEARALLDDKNVRIDLLAVGLASDDSTAGDEVARLAVKDRPDVPVLFMSKQCRDTMVESGRVDEQAVYLEKPFTAEELTTHVRTCLGED